MKIHMLFLAGSVLWLSSAHAGNLHIPNAAEEILEKCSYDSQAGMHDCLAENVRESSRVLASAEKKLASALARWDERPKFVRKAGRQFISANAAYLTYRDAQCTFAYALGGGAIGNALELRSLACVYGLNMERAGQLTHLASTLPPK